MSRELGNALNTATEHREQVDPVHVVLEILDQPTTRAVSVIEAIGIQVADVRDELNALIKQAEGKAT